MNARQTAQVNQVVGAVGMPPPQSQTQDAWVDSQFVMMRGNAREKIFEYIGRKPSSADWRRRLPHLARRLEEILFRKYPSKREYYNMMKGQIEPHLQFAIKELSAQNQQRQRNQQLSRQIASSPGYGTMILTPGITQGASETSRMSYVTGNIGPSSSGADMVPLNANMGEAPNQHVNTLLSLGMNSTHHDRPRACNNNLVIDTVDTPATNRLLESHAPLKEVRKEPKFSCPVCMNELVDASSTICGHIFCQKCIQASIQAQSKCPTCRRTLTMNSFHRVYLPTMD
ncbi:probable histone acetyltransferase HAC-like 1 [Triticum dicoccoides]|uniref:probable histone acetyltransferase HAC-like 1 n=1 Tax=Triticum dicoccoides TaxID=85692 RepID=UPI0018906ECB|nr:probable histone acetyltransferase HAC-like 1 [Triticum dicoccoides]